VLRINCKRYVLILSVLLCCVSFTEAQRRPVIGISDLYKDENSSAVPRSYVDAVLQVGGLPVVIPLMYDNDKIVELLGTLDGIIFTGGEDFDPSYYNERPIPQMGKINAHRDEFDIKLLHLAVEQGVPVLGICRGLQLINIAYGGSLYQDLSAQYHDNSIRHRQRQPKEDASHSVLVEENTVFADIVKDRMLMVNSSHHQAIKKVAPGFHVAGKSPDKIVEVIEKIDSKNWILGVQFHPEVRVMRDNAMRRIFQRFIDEAASSNNQNRNTGIASITQNHTNSDRATERQMPPRSQSQFSSSSQLQTQPQPQRQIAHNSVVDTQYIYKFVVDTQYIYKSIDTVYLSVVDTLYVTLPTDTVYLSVVDTLYEYYPKDTVYLSVVDTIYFPVDYVSDPISETKKPVSVIKKQKTGKPAGENSTEKKPTIEKSKPKKQTPENQAIVNQTTEKQTVEKPSTKKQTPEKLATDNIKSVSDTMIFTPGTPVISSSGKKKDTVKDSTKVAEKDSIRAMEAKAIETQKAMRKAEENEIKKAKIAKEEAEKKAKAEEKKAKAEEKARLKAAKKEAEDKEQQYRQEQMELAKQKKKEQKEKEEQAKKEAKIKKET